jgi:hypothetical protein
MATETDLQTRLEALKRALASGRKSVSYGDTRVEYRSIDELKAAIADVETDLAGLQGKGVIRGYRISSCKGL